MSECRTQTWRTGNWSRGIIVAVEANGTREIIWSGRTNVGEVGTIISRVADACGAGHRQRCTVVTTGARITIGERGTSSLIAYCSEGTRRRGQSAWKWKRML